MRVPLRVFAAKAFALLLPIAAHAQTAGGYRITGRVVNSTTGEPVPRATVSALSEDSNSVAGTTMTNAEGMFTIAPLAAGKYPLSASRRGYRTAYYDEHEESFNTAIVTGPDQDTGHLVFKLAPGAVIYGTVTGDGGDPEQRANVMLFRSDPALGSNPAAAAHHPVQMETTATDDIGAYEFSGLPTGQYFIAVQAHPWYAVHGLAQQPQPGENPLDVAYPITFFDSTTEEAAATPLAVDAGSRTEANIALHAVPALHLTVPRSPRNNNGPEVEVRQSLFGSKLAMGLNIESVGRGPWDVTGLAPGHYEVRTTDPARTAEVDATASMEVDPATGAPSQPVDGTVRMADGSPAGDVNLNLAQNDSQGVMSNARAAGGHFHFDAVPPGVWTLSAVNQRASLYVASVTVGSGTVPANQIAVRDHPVTLAATLSSSQTKITGFARNNGKPAAGAMIVLVPSGVAARDPAAWPALARRDQSDSDGSFSLADVPPGRYTVVAIDGWNIDWRDRAVIARYLPGGEAVTIDTQASGMVRLPQPVQTAAP